MLNVTAPASDGLLLHWKLGKGPPSASSTSSATTMPGLQRRFASSLRIASRLLVSPVATTSGRLLLWFGELGP